MEHAFTALAPLAVSADEAEASLRDRPERAFGAHHRAERYRTAMTVAGSGLEIAHEITVAIERLPATAAGPAWSCRGEPVGHDRVLPSFRGRMTVERGEGRAVLRLTGTYTVPLGRIGAMGDGIAGRRVASRALTRFVRQMGARIDADATAHRPPFWLRAAPYAPDLRPDLRDAGPAR